MSTLRQGYLLAAASLVLALVLAFPGAALSGSSSHSHTGHVPAETGEVDPLVESRSHENPCHHEGMSGAESSGVGHHGGNHDAGGCCATAVCGGACAGVCSGVGASGVLPGTLVPGMTGGGGLAFRKVEDTVLPGTREAPFRPPITELAGSAG